MGMRCDGSPEIGIKIEREHVVDFERRELLHRALVVQPQKALPSTEA
jgi:hypothetical protein